MFRIRYLIRQFYQTVKQKGYRQALMTTVRYFIINVNSWVSYTVFLLKSPSQLLERIIILKRFRKIHRLVPCAHSERDLLFIADTILRIPSRLKGDIVECGVYKGGCTCKLSIVANMTGRKLIACDSFEGLPAPKDYDVVHVYSNGKKELYKKGDWRGSLKEVRANIDKFGESSSVELVRGWFQESLPKLEHRKFASIFLDVDLKESIECCLLNLWPRLQPGCRLFTHEADHDLTLKLFSSREFWVKNFGHNPPKFIIGKNLNFTSSVLGYTIKKNLSL